MDKPIYMPHPLITGLTCHKNGKKFKYNGKIVRAIKVIQKRKSGKEIPTWKVFFNKTSYSPYKLTLEAWWGLHPNDGKLYYARVKDGDKDNLSYKNLHWTGDLNTKYDPTSADQQTSKLDFNQTRDIFLKYKDPSKKTSLKSLGEEYDVSDMTIHRAIKRYKKLYLKNHKK